MIHAIRAGLAAAIVLSMNAWLWPPGGLSDHRNAAIDESRRDDIERLKPQVIFVGNSILGHGVDEWAFSQHAQVDTYKVWHIGTGVAWWYLALKNLIIPASHKPDLLVVFFRDNELTLPALYARNYEYIDQVAALEEPVLDKLAYEGQMNALALFLTKAAPLAQKGPAIKAAVDSAVKNAVASCLLGLKAGKADEAIARVFADKNMNAALMGVRQDEFEASQNPREYDFDKVVDRSFLPYFLDLTEKAKIHLAFVRMKKRRDLTPGAEPAMVRDYIARLRLYLEHHGIPMVDYTHEDRLKPEHYGLGDHLYKGKTLFTEMLVNDLGGIIRDTVRPAPPDPPGNSPAQLLENPGFEEWGEYYPNLARHWTTVTTTDPLRKETQDTVEGHCALSVQSSNNARGGMFQAFQLPTSAAGKRLTFRARAKANKGSRVFLELRALHDSWDIKTSRLHPGDGEWHDLAVSVDLPPRLGWCRGMAKVVHECPGDARALFDDASVHCEENVKPASASEWKATVPQ